MPKRDVSPPSSNRSSGIFQNEECLKKGDPVKGVYQILNLKDGKRYVGSSSHIYRRWVHHRTDLRGGKHHAPHLQRAYAAYGEESFEFSILETVTEDSAILPLEQHYLDALKPEYNVAPIAGRNVGIKRNPFTDEHRKRISEAKMGYKHREDAKAKMSQSRLGKKQTPEHIENAAKTRRGKGFSAEAVENMRLAQIRPVKCVETGQVFPSVREAGNWCKEQGLTKSDQAWATVNRSIRIGGKGYKLTWVEA